MKINYQINFDIDTIVTRQDNMDEVVADIEKLQSNLQDAIETILEQSQDHHEYTKVRNILSMNKDSYSVEVRFTNPKNNRKALLTRKYGVV